MDSTLNSGTGDMGAFAGRACGLPKKLGDVDLVHEGDQYSAYAARNGICYASFGVDTSGEPNDPRFAEAAALFNKPVSKVNPAVAIFIYIWEPLLRKFLPPKLNPTWFGTKPSVEPKAAFANVALNMSVHDPWASLPVVKGLGGGIFTGIATLDQSDHSFWTDIDPDAYLPYSYLAWDLPPVDQVKR